MVPKKIGLLILYFFFACNNIDAITAIIFYLKADIIIYIFLMLHIIIVISESNVKYRCITDLLQVRHAHRGFVRTKGHSFNRTCIFTNIFGNINTFNERCNELSQEGAVFVCSFSSSFGDDIINPWVKRAPWKIRRIPWDNLAKGITTRSEMILCALDCRSRSGSRFVSLACLPFSCRIITGRNIHPSRSRRNTLETCIRRYSTNTICVVFARRYASSTSPPLITARHGNYKINFSTTGNMRRINKTFPVFTIAKAF